MPATNFVGEEHDAALVALGTREATMDGGTVKDEIPGGSRPGRARRPAPAPSRATR
jgi:hypothetical protein